MMGNLWNTSWIAHQDESSFLVSWSRTFLNLQIQAAFPSGSEAILKARLQNVWAANIRQFSESYALIQLQHGSDGHCTVRCPRTGEALTGVNPCVRCPTSQGDI